MKQLLSFFILLFLFVSFSFAGNILVGSKSYPVDTLAHFKVGPGTQYTALQLIDAAKPLRVFFLEVDAKNPYIQMKTVLGKDSTITTERPSDMAKRKTKEGAVYFAGTNGDFFITAGQVGLPVAGCMVDGEIAVVPNSRPVVAFDRNTMPFIGTKTFSGKVSFGVNSFPVSNVNTTRNTNQLILYNSLNGHFTHTNTSGTEVLVQLIDTKWDVNKILKAKVLNVSGKGNMVIPAGSAVLSGHGTAQTFLNTLKVDDEVDINLEISVGTSEKPLLSDMVGGDRFILKDGLVTDNDWVDPNPRTAIGYSADKSKIYFCVVDGRSGISVGISTKQLADIMKSAGAYTALNVDGGGSSCMYVKEFNVMNDGSDGSERAVANGMFAVSSAPADLIMSEIKAYENSIELPKFGVFKPKFLGYNQYGTLLNTDVQGVTLSCPAELGYINDLGELVASGTQNGVLTATSNGIQTTVNIILQDEAQIAFRLDSVLIDNLFEYPIEIQSVIGQNTMKVLPSALNWEVRKLDICVVENGTLKGLSNGKTWVVGNLGTFKDSIQVQVEIPTTGTMVQNDFSTPLLWTLTAQTNWNATLSSANLPAGWQHGCAINYQYQSNRAPSVKLAYTMPMYSLLDTLKIEFNTGAIELSKLIVSLKANNQTQFSSTEFFNIPKNIDTQVSIAINKLIPNSLDKASFPVWFDYMTFYIKAASQIVNTNYTLAIKEISLCYAGLTVSSYTPAVLSTLKVYPNPVVGNEMRISLKNAAPQLIRLQIYNVSGQLVRTENLGIQQAGDVILPMHGLTTGTYFLKIYQNDKIETVKIVVK